MRALVVAIVLAAACGGKGSPPSGSWGPSGRSTGAGAPPIELVLPALDGGELSLAAYRGKVVVLHVFSTWSLAAQAEVEALSTADAAEDVVVIGIALDTEGRPLVAPWRNGSDVRYLVALADDPTRAGQSALGALSAIPITIVLDRAGRLAVRADRQLTSGELERMIATARDR